MLMKIGQYSVSQIGVIGLNCRGCLKILSILSALDSSGRLWNKWKHHSEASFYQGRWRGFRVRGRELPAPQGGSHEQTQPRPSLPPAFPPALPAVAAKDHQTSRRSQPTHKPADPCGELWLPAAGPQSSVRSPWCVLTHSGNVTFLVLLTALCFICVFRFVDGIEAENPCGSTQKFEFSPSGAQTYMPSPVPVTPG